jgi:hypothetical protein
MIRAGRDVTSAVPPWAVAWDSSPVAERFRSPLVRDIVESVSKVHPSLVLPDVLKRANAAFWAALAASNLDEPEAIDQLDCFVLYRLSSSSAPLLGPG